MHIDYILPASSTASDWQVINFTAVPDTYNSSYAMSEMTSNQTADTNRTSYTYATAETGGGTLSYKLPVVGNISASLKSVTENKNEIVSEQYVFQQNEFQYNASTTTGLGDEIWYDESTFNVYYYPVLGQTICPTGESSCAPADEQPLYVAISGPNSAGTGPGPGASTEWYQPVHETGNIFSYPWNETMLAQQIPQGIQLLSGPQSFFTDDSSQAQHLSWSQSGDNSQTAGTTNTHSYEKSYSLTGGGIVANLVGSSTPGNFSYNDSSSISTLNKSSSSVGASQGVTIVKPGSFLENSLYQYQVQPFIFGRLSSPNTVDAVSLPQNIQTTGPLQTAFAANPSNSNAGSWWSGSPYAQAIDVALNHPRRWNISTPSGTQTTLNCLVAGGRNNCLTFNEPDASDLWNSEFYWMRGLFVTVNGLDGPQRNQATAGEEVNLQARIYNYSFMDMPSNSTIKVQFYRQAINGTIPSGDSVLIAEESANPLPGFNSTNSPDTPNWAMVTTTLDTTGLDNTYHIFWVVVWVEDGSGNLLTELQGHGLDAKPGTLTSIDQVSLEMVDLDGANTTFSNNVGYLHLKFYIAPASTQLPGAELDAVLSIQNAVVTPEDATPGEKVIISADITSDDAAANAVHVQFFPDASVWEAHQADPSQPVPRPFDLELIPHIGAGETDRLEVPYRADNCGTQHILIVAKSGATGEVTTATAEFSTGDCLVYSPILAISSSN